MESYTHSPCSRSKFRTKRGDIDIGPKRAEDLIRDLLKAEKPDDEIIAILLNLGPPAGWIEKTIQRYRRR